MSTIFTPEEMKNISKDIDEIYLDVKSKQTMFYHTMKQCKSRKKDREKFITEKIYKMVNRIYNGSKYINITDLFYIFSLMYINEGLDVQCQYDGLMSDGMIEKYVNFTLNNLPSECISISAHGIASMYNKRDNTNRSINFIFGDRDKRDLLVDQMKMHIEEYTKYFKEKAIFDSITIHVGKAMIENSYLHGLYHGHHSEGNIFVNVLNPTTDYTFNFYEENKDV